MMPRDMILLDNVTGFLSWLPYAFPVVVGVISYFFKQDKDREKERVDRMDAENKKDHENFEKYIKELEKDNQEVRKIINEVNLQVLKDINELGIKLAEYKRELKN